MTDLWPSGVFFQALNTPKLVFGRGSAPDPAVGAYDAPQTSSQLGTGTPLPIPSPFDAFGVSVVRPPNLAMPMLFDVL